MKTTNANPNPEECRIADRTLRVVVGSAVQPSFAQTGYAVGKMGRVLRTTDGKSGII
jgi:hypothetical protein